MRTRKDPVRVSRIESHRPTRRLGSFISFESTRRQIIPASSEKYTPPSFSRALATNTSSVLSDLPGCSHSFPAADSRLSGSTFVRHRGLIKRLGRANIYVFGRFGSAAIDLTGIFCGMPSFWTHVFPSSADTSTPDDAVPTQIVPGTSEDAWTANTFSLTPSRRTIFPSLLQHHRFGRAMSVPANIPFFHLRVEPELLPFP